MANNNTKCQSPLLGDQEVQPRPRALPILPMPDMVLFPRIIMPLALWEEPAQKLVNDVLLHDKTMGFLAGQGGEARGLWPGKSLPGRHRRGDLEDAQIRR